MTSTQNIDGQKIEIEYKTRTETSTDNLGNDNTVSIITNVVENCKKTNGNEIIENIEFLSPSPYYRVVKNLDKHGNELSREEAFYNTNIQRIVYIDKDGNKSYYCYNVNADSSAYEVPQLDSSNLVQNPSFQEKKGFGSTVAKIWTVNDTKTSYRDSRPYESTYYCMHIIGDRNKTNYAKQDIDVSNIESLSSGDVYSIGGSGYCTLTIPEGSDFVEQANWMKRYAYSNKNCLTRYVEKSSDFIEEWNSLYSYSIKDIHLYLHGYPGNLSFKDDDISVDDIKELKKINISGKVYLYSCNGGTKNSYGETAAGEIAKLVAGARVRAVVNGKVYYRAWYQLFSRKPLTKEKGAYWADFHYGKYKGKMTVYSNSIGKTWRL